MTGITGQLSIDTPGLGTIIVTVDDDGAISRLVFSDEPSYDARTDGNLAFQAINNIEREIQSYLSGAAMACKLPYRVTGTSFQRLVWERLQNIPYGETSTYGQIASSLGRPGAARAVGGACGANPVPLIIPCHRAVAADGSLGGFSSGLWRKRWLIAFEG